MDFQATNIKSPLFFLLILVFISFANTDNAKGGEECAESLVGLATCLPYVGGTAKVPTPDCCTALKQILKANKKCLCLLIKDRNDPDLGLNINVTLALGLPQVCSAPANISQCPALLKLPPGSPDAEIFYQVGQKSSNTTSPVTGDPNTNVKSNPTRANTQQASGGCGNGKRRQGLEIFGELVLLWAFTANFVI